MRTGRGDYAKDDWDRAITAAENVSNESIVGDLAEEVDLHDADEGAIRSRRDCPSEPAGVTRPPCPASKS